jgi:hypothetical protein
MALYLGGLSQIVSRRAAAVMAGLLAARGGDCALRTKSGIMRMPRTRALRTGLRSRKGTGSAEVLPRARKAQGTWGILIGQPRWNFLIPFPHSRC